MKYRGFVADVLNRECENPLARTVAGAVLGSEDFAEAIIAEYLEKEERDDNVLALVQMAVFAPSTMNQTRLPIDGMGRRIQQQLIESQVKPVTKFEADLR